MGRTVNRGFDLTRYEIFIRTQVDRSGVPISPRNRKRQLEKIRRLLYNSFGGFVESSMRQAAFDPYSGTQHMVKGRVFTVCPNIEPCPNSSDVIYAATECGRLLNQETVEVAWGSQAGEFECFSPEDDD